MCWVFWYLLYKESQLIYQELDSVFNSYYNPLTAYSSEKRCDGEK